MGVVGLGQPSKPSSGAMAACPIDGSSPDCPLKVMIVLSNAVACPGHPLPITAVGTPSGGTYSWNISGDGELVDTAGAPVNTGEAVNLRSFKPDNITGNIPGKMANIRVTYKHPRGTVTDAKDIQIHKIDFEITNTDITSGVTQANENDSFVELGGAPGQDTMVTDPKVKIKLAEPCPRKTDCAQNHRVGWLQTVISDDRRIRYTHTLRTVKVPLPIRDGDPVSGPSPFPFYDAAPSFTGDGDTKTAHHFDSPGQRASWTDSRLDAPAPPPAKNRQLRKIFFQTHFTAWLVVQNKEWSVHDLAGSFAFQKHFDWSSHLDVNIDMSKDVQKRCTPASSVPTISLLGDGKGSSSPELTAPVANEKATIQPEAAPEI